MGELVGKVVQGTLIHDGKRFWVRWNKRKCDTVFVKPSLLKAVLGEEPKVGTQIKCTIQALGPDLSKMICQTAWFMHPQTNEIEVVAEAPRTRKPARFIKKSPAGVDRSRFFGTRSATGSTNWRVRY